MDGMISALGAAWDFATAHPFVCAWLAVATAWAVFTMASRDAA